jgi:hypothetical protein
MKVFRQGDVIIQTIEQIEGNKIDCATAHPSDRLILAEGEVTGHKHRISEGQAELYDRDGILYLKVLSETAILSHEEHKAIAIPQDNWMIRIQREYEPEGWRYVTD